MTEMKTMNGKLDSLQEDVAVLKEDVAVLKEDVAVLKEDVAVLKEEVAVLKEDVAVLKEEVAVLKEDVAGLKKDVTSLQKDMEDVKERITRIEVLQLENNVIPRLNTIEQCYLETSKRYMQETADIKQMKSDIEVIKFVVTQHSKKFEEQDRQIKIVP
jgi:chromosome segregation ATPase